MYRTFRLCPVSLCLWSAASNSLGLGLDQSIALLCEPWLVRPCVYPQVSIPPLTWHYIHNPTGILKVALDTALVILYRHWDSCVSRYSCFPLVRSLRRTCVAGWHSCDAAIAIAGSQSTHSPSKWGYLCTRHSCCIQRDLQYPSGVIYSNPPPPGGERWHLLCPFLCRNPFSLNYRATWPSLSFLIQLNHPPPLCYSFFLLINLGWLLNASLS